MLPGHLDLQFVLRQKAPMMIANECDSLQQLHIMSEYFQFAMVTSTSQEN